MKTNSIRSSQPWHDTNGEVINAHAAGMLHHGGVYYWYGESRPQGPASLNARQGFRCYSSSDLMTWSNEGIVLAVVEDNETHPLAAGCKMERPKCAYNARTGKFVLWWHHDLKGWGHNGALAGVAVADKPTGPFKFIEVMRPALAMFRDCTLFVDDDGSAWLIFATDDNRNLGVCRLSDDYLKPEGGVHRVFPGRYMEAPCVFKHDGRYFLIGSDCSGWHPNEARSAWAPALTGPWQEFGNPCLGEGAEITYGTQSTYVLPIAGRPGCYIFMADLWKPQDLADSRYVWLPLQFRMVPGYSVPRPFVKWCDEWTLEDLK